MIVNLTHAVVVYPDMLAKPEERAVAMLLDEVEKRTRIRWRTSTEWPNDDSTVIAVGTGSALQNLAGNVEGQAGPQADIGEGFRIHTVRDESASSVFVIGNDSRGVLFAVGRLLRELRMSRDRVTLPADVNIVSAPKHKLRGHQLGYRPKTNSYDGWSVSIWEEYIRDLVVFGTNAIELIPPRSDDDADSPHFPLPPMEMMVRMAQLLDDYGLDVWIWYPAMDDDYSDPATVQSALREWGDVFHRLPRIDAIFVPGGDPGHTQPKHLMALLEKQTENLHRYHPNAQMWVSPQGFSQAWLDEFLEILREEPEWFTGVVFGPQVRVDLRTLRKLVPSRYPMRHYPDITHTRQCQFPVPDWDMAYSITEARECINPRPIDQSVIFRAFKQDTIGFLTYSEGCNDDVNKIVWSALGWNPDEDVNEILRQYSRYFIGDKYTDDFAQGLLALEKNWQGPLSTNESLATTLQQFQIMEQSASPQDKLNWRFQQALYRAYYDAYVQQRLVYESGLENLAREKLGQSRGIGSLTAIDEANDILERGVTHRVAVDLRARVFELAEALFQSIRMQLSVTRYQAIAVGRGANLDTIDMPLNSRLWMKGRMAEIRAMSSEDDRLSEIHSLVHWTDPSPGGFYDDLGNPACQPHLDRGPGFDNDPDFRESAMLGFSYHPEGPVSWWTHAQSLYDAPLRMHYPQLDMEARYKIRVVYAGDSPSIKIRLVANEEIEIHPLISKPSPIRPIDFDIPQEATRNGELTLEWYRESGLGGNGRGCQVAEVWLIRK